MTAVSTLEGVLWLACMTAITRLATLHYSLPLFKKNHAARVGSRREKMAQGGQASRWAEQSPHYLHHSQGYRWRTPVRSRLHANRHPLHRAKRAD
jgi:hypothetical protein